MKLHKKIKIICEARGENSIMNNIIYDIDDFTIIYNPCFFGTEISEIFERSKSESIYVTEDRHVVTNKINENCYYRNRINEVFNEISMEEIL